MTLQLYKKISTTNNSSSLLLGFGSVYDGMGRLDEQGLPRLKGEAVPNKQHQLEVAHIKVWRKLKEYRILLSMAY
jgi:hypothetical protein